MNENKNIDPKLAEALKGLWDSLIVLHIWEEPLKMPGVQP
jgi:hypothetical protein